MNACDDIQQQILLEQSGELENAAALNEHLSSCEACRIFRLDLAGVSALAAEALPSADAPDNIVRKILNPASEPELAQVIRGPWKQLLTLAACVAFIAVVAVRLMTPPTPLTSAPGVELSAAEDIRALIQVYDDDAAEDAMLENEAPSDIHMNAVDALASDLLKMQGFDIGMGEELLLSSI